MMNKIELTIIGCGDAFANGGRFHTCFYVKSPNCNLLIDCGASAFTSLKQNGIENKDIDVILISHFHGDHYGGLPFILLDANIAKREKPLTIFSPTGGKEKIELLFALLYPDSKLSEELIINFKEYSANKVFFTRSLKVLAIPVKHKQATLPHGFRITIGSTVISYSGDTEWTSALEKLAKDADLFICECNFYETYGEGHMNYKTLTENLAKLTFKRILLTHFSDEMLENLKHIKIDWAVDGLKIQI
jgi:ribonuclease BN (tRNA processing enzyme)